MVFLCSESLQGHIYPNPGSPGVFILNFIDDHGTCILDDPGLTIYDMGDMGDIAWEENKRVKVEWGAIMPTILLGCSC
jgi:hypothetical protein